MTFKVVQKDHLMDEASVAIPGVIFPRIGKGELKDEVLVLRGELSK